MQCMKSSFVYPKGRFIVYLIGLYLFDIESTIANCADTNTPFSCELNTDSVVQSLTNNCKLLFEWFANSGLKANSFLPIAYDVKI